jgi:acylpyruvate hydrolase
VRFASCEYAGTAFAAAIVDDAVVPVDGVTELDGAALQALSTDPPLAHERSVAVDDVTFRPVVPAPRRIICVGLNYLAHIGETGRDIPEYPVLFTKFADALIGARDPIVLPPESRQVDYEGELAVVIGRPGRRIAREDALEHVAGYAVANDVTMRDFQYKTHQWLQGKAWASATPLGPWLVTPDELGDASELELRVTVNDEVVQHASTAQMMFDVRALIGHISVFTTLEPGDILLTGTPGGVGYRRDPQLFLAPGDRVTVEIEKVGKLDNPVAAEPVDAAPAG